MSTDRPAPGIRKIRLAISNAFLVRGQRPLLIDAGSPGEAPRILNAIEAAGVAPKEVALILLTHAHRDHAGGARALREATGAPVALHPADAHMLVRGRMDKLRAVRARHKPLCRLLDRPFPALAPDIELTDGQRLYEFGLPAGVLETPGHTAGSVSIALDCGDALAGDLLIGGHLEGRLARRTPRLPYVADDVPQLRKSVQRLLGAADGPGRSHHKSLAA